MTRKDIGREVVILIGTAGISGVLFWMGVYLAGPVTILPGAGALFVALVMFRKQMTGARLLAERAALACLLASQAALFAGVCIEVLPTVARSVL